MKHHSLGLMIAIILLQSACSSQEERIAQQGTNFTAIKPVTNTDNQDSRQYDSAAIDSASPQVSRDDLSGRIDVNKTLSYKQKDILREATQVSGQVLAYAPAPPAVANIYNMPREERDRFAHFDDNPIKQVANDPVSTFSLDVDTGSYALVRQFIQQGRLPASDAVRTEELINYFSDHSPQKKNHDAPFSTETELSTAPWQPTHYLLRIGVKTQDIQTADMPPANLVFLVDVSGSMNEPNKLPLVVSSLQMLTQQLRPQDKVSLVVYAGRTEVVLEPTDGNHKADIQAALARLQAGGSTAGASALSLAYKMAKKGYINHGINRILLATDGDFNVGTTDINQLKDMVKRERETGITLSTLGFGQGNYNDAMMEQIADVGNGNYSYIDSLTEARKVLVDELSSTFNTVAKDVKIQIEFNPTVVSEYRLLGYENRKLNREDFNNDQVDAGDVGAGKSVTAIYEITPNNATPAIDALRYQHNPSAMTPNRPTYRDSTNQELAFLKIRYKKPDATRSILLTYPIANPQRITEFAHASDNQRFTTAVAGFGQLLRQSSLVNHLTYDQVAQIAQQAKGSDPTGNKGEFVQLVKNAAVLVNQKENVISDD